MGLIFFKTGKILVGESLMPFSQTVYVAICFNSEAEALALSESLKDLAPKITFITASSFDGFLKAIAAAEKIDCFIIEEDFEECSSYDLIEKLKKSTRYRKSVRALLTSNLKTIHSKFLELNNHYYYDQKTGIADIRLNLKKCITKKLTPIIPKDYNVLVLDNSHEVLEIISMHLNDLGHTKMDLCYSILEAKKQLLEKDFDLLLLDWNLDDGTCIDLIDFIKKESLSERTKSALAMVITGRDDVDDIMTLLRYGVKDHIIKPFGFNEFEDKISYAIEKHIKKAV